MNETMDQPTFVDGVLESQTPPNQNGFVTFNVTVEGFQYPVRMSTKLPAVIEQVSTVGIDPARWHYVPRQGNENPNKPGTHYVNRGLSKVELLSAAESAPRTPQAAVSAPAANGATKDSLIVRQTVVKALGPAFSAVAQLQGPDRINGEASLFAYARRLEDACINGFPGSRPDTDDDIPF